MNSSSVKRELRLSPTRHIAYHLSEGKNPCVIFMGGFKSDMTGSKALALEAYCQTHGQRFVRFDYTGHGQSSGAFIDGTIGEWAQDALAVADALGGDEFILIGSSMGAWISLLTALACPDKVKAFIGIASAPDFTEKLIWEQLDEAQKKGLTESGVFYAPSCYGEDPYPITQKLIEDGRKHLLMDAPISLTCPVRLLHGDKDADVPWQHSVKLMELLASSDVQLRLVKDGDHRLSSPDHLQLLCNTLEEFLPNP